MSQGPSRNPVRDLSAVFFLWTLCRATRPRKCAHPSGRRLAPYGHDGRSINLKEVILRHGGDALTARNAFAELASSGKAAIV